MTMPNEEILPIPVQPITRRNAIELSNTRFKFDMERLINAVRKVLDATEAKRKANKESPRRLEQELPSPWRTYGPTTAAVAVVLIIFIFVFWWPKRQEAPKEAESQKKPTGEISETRIETTSQKKAEPQKEVASKAMVVDRKQEKPITTQPVLSAGKVFRDRLKNGQEGPEMVVIPAGSFQMGDLRGEGDENEVPVHTVRFQKPFAIGRYEVTFEEYDQFATATDRQLPSDQGWERGRRPVINV